MNDEKERLNVENKERKPKVELEDKTSEAQARVENREDTVRNIQDKP